MKSGSHSRQLLGSLVAACLIVIAVIAVVTLKFGSTSAAELEALNERQEQRLEAREQRSEDAREQREEELERR